MRPARGSRVWPRDIKGVMDYPPKNIISGGLARLTKSTESQENGEGEMSEKNKSRKRKPTVTEISLITITEIWRPPITEILRITYTRIFKTPIKGQIEKIWQHN
jgi:hypothetical protein